MARSNTRSSYGSITKTFHWLTAFLILSMIPLGVIANDMAYQIKDPNIPSTGKDIARVAWLFSLHKTIGIALFFTALLRIVWAFSQPKPGLLNGDKALEALAATTVHWLLYSSLVIVPLSGWIHHAATTGFAPIWWPFGQSLPFVPKDEFLAEQTATLHWISNIVLVGALTLHIAGALKHHVIDKDATLRRMLPGLTAGEPTKRQPGEALPVMAALTVWIAVIFVGTSLLLPEKGADAAPFEEATLTPTEESEWTVTDGSLLLSVMQFGSTVDGSFDDWSASIDYTEAPDEAGSNGSVKVIINVASLSLGSVTDQAKGVDYFDLARYPTAIFEAEIFTDDTGHVAKGSLKIKDQSVPLEMPFDLTLDGDTAEASAALTLDRRDFLIGMGTTDEATLGFAVEVEFSLTAIRGDVPEELEVSEPPVVSTGTDDGWTVNEGTLGLAVSQFGSTVEGGFSQWSAKIDYEEEPDADGRHGSVIVDIDITSLSLGSVTDQAQGADYFDANSFPTAQFDAQIMMDETGGHVAVGTLTIKDQSVPVEIPFDLSLDGNAATASGTLDLDRRDFLIGMGTQDEGTLGFTVQVIFSLTAMR